MPPARGHTPRSIANSATLDSAAAADGAAMVIPGTTATSTSGTMSPGADYSALLELAARGAFSAPDPQSLLADIVAAEAGAAGDPPLASPGFPPTAAGGASTLPGAASATSSKHGKQRPPSGTPAHLVGLGEPGLWRTLNTPSGSRGTAGQGALLPHTQSGSRSEWSVSPRGAGIGSHPGGHGSEEAHFTSAAGEELFWGRRSSRASYVQSRQQGTATSSTSPSRAGARSVAELAASSLSPSRARSRASVAGRRSSMGSAVDVHKSDTGIHAVHFANLLRNNRALGAPAEREPWPRPLPATRRASADPATVEREVTRHWMMVKLKHVSGVID